MLKSEISEGKRIVKNSFLSIINTVNGDKYYADKPEIIDALKHNIHEAIGEMQLHTIANVLKNWTDREGNCMASRDSHLNEIIFHY